VLRLNRPQATVSIFGHQIDPGIDTAAITRPISPEPHRPECRGVFRCGLKYPLDQALERAAPNRSSAPKLANRVASSDTGAD
jgi:hypothetical protein